MEFVLSQKIYEQAKQQVAEGETYDLETLCKNLVNMGYVRQAQVESLEIFLCAEEFWMYFR